MSGKLRSRLERLRRSGELAGARPAAEKPKINLAAESFLFPGEESLEKTAAGSCYLRELSFPLEQQHGKFTLAESLNCRGSDLSLPARDRSLPLIDPDRYLFLDIETTGLSGGTGTWVFLIGLGWREGGAFRMRQYFLRHPGEEEAMLRHFDAFAAPFSGLVTFNGKMFDLPLIQTRQTLRRAPRTAPPAHLDLLVCARSLWRKRFPSRRLGFLEEELLGFRRRGDIPGEEIPSVYFDYLRRGSTGRLLQVFEHNVFDILSMAVLLGRVASVTASDKPPHPAECFSLGRLHHEVGNLEKAESYYRQVKEGEGLEEAALSRLALLYKKQGKWAKAVDLWKKLACKENGSPEAAVELAKYYEHRIRDYLKALRWSSRALSQAPARRTLPPSSPAHPAALQHRINRLKAKAKAAKEG